MVHLFFTAGADVDVDAALSAVKSAEGEGVQIVLAAMLGHKSDLCVMGLSEDVIRLRVLQADLRGCGLALRWSYVSMTEVSEYAAGLPAERVEARLHPLLPPSGMRAFCFYPMSKRRLSGDNWYSLDFESRRRLMEGHGATGREFAGRVLQLVTGSTGLDDWEWGVTLFGRAPDDLKEVVYRMRFDEASARFAEFGPFFSGAVIEAADLPWALVPA